MKRWRLCYRAHSKLCESCSCSPTRHVDGASTSLRAAHRPGGGWQELLDRQQRAERPSGGGRDPLLRYSPSRGPGWERRRARASRGAHGGTPGNAPPRTVEVGLGRRSLTLWTSPFRFVLLTNPYIVEGVALPRGTAGHHVRRPRQPQASEPLPGPRCRREIGRGKRRGQSLRRGARLYSRGGARA